jgi:hypothetical protein
MTSDLDSTSLLMQILERTLQTQEKTLEKQEKMSDDISEIKGAIREAVKTVSFLYERLENVRTEHKQLSDKVDSVKTCFEKHPTECPARQRHNAWSFSLKDLLWFATLAGALAAVYAASKS